MVSDRAISARPVGRLARISFAIIMVGFTALFVVFGVWQLQRLEWKDALIASAAERIGGPPQALPPVQSWPGLDVWGVDFTPVVVTGTFAQDPPIRVFIGLTDPKGQQGGPGHWYIYRFEPESGGSVFVNRGFVPQDNDGFTLPPVGRVTFDAIVRRPERAGSFTLDAEVENRLEWVINPARFAQSWDMGPEAVAPFYLDLPPGVPGALPQTGETDFTFPNKHLGYALTWLGMAVVTPIFLLFWLWNTRSRAQSPRSAAVAPNGRRE